MIKNSRSYRLATLIVGVICTLNPPAFAAEHVPVDIDNFVRAETGVFR